MDKKTSSINVANIITLSRFALMPLIAFFYFSSSFILYGKLVALVLFVVAATTDFIDGWVARRFNQITDLGKLLDPIADKLLTFLGFLLIFSDITILGVLYPIWFAFLIFFIATLRDYVVNVLRQLAALKNKAMAADWYAKVKSSVQYVGISLAMLYAYLLHATDLLESSVTEPILRYSVWAILGLSVLLSIFSGNSYIKTYRKICREHATHPNQQGSLE